MRHTSAPQKSGTESLLANRGGVYSRLQVYRYVEWRRVEDFLAMGWMPGNPASEWSMFMFACVCNPEGKAPIHDRARD